MDALTAIQVLSEGLTADMEAPDAARDGLTGLLRAASQKLLWRNGVVPSATINTVADVVERHPWAFAGEVERSVLVGLARLVCGTAIQVTGGVRNKMDGAGQDVWMKLLVRRTAARLAYKLFERYRDHGDAIPKEIAAWKDVCQSDDEFAEVRNQWIDAGSGLSGPGGDG